MFVVSPSPCLPIFLARALPFWVCLFAQSGIARTRLRFIHSAAVVLDSYLVLTEEPSAAASHCNIVSSSKRCRVPRAQTSFSEEELEMAVAGKLRGKNP